MTEDEKNRLQTAVIDNILAEDRTRIGPVIENPRHDQPGIWIMIMGEQAFLGTTIEAAMLTARLSDWWIPPRDGKMLSDDVEWFDERATLGDDWERKEISMFREERRTRLAMNIQLATRGDLDEPS